MASIEVVPVLNDNYTYIIHGSDVTGGIVVDPGAADPVIAALERLGVTASHIINTHHHGDHIAGNDALKARYGTRVIGPEADRPRNATLDQGVRGGDQLFIAGIGFDAIATPGHTLGHICFHAPSLNALFAGDALFALGCGRMFEGDPIGMWAGLQALRALPTDTLIYCGHEYTQNNARFALSVDPDNQALKAYISEINTKRAYDIATMPAPLSRECGTNPFLRADDPGLAAAMGFKVGPIDGAKVFAALRSAKDRA